MNVYCSKVFAILLYNERVVATASFIVSRTPLKGSLICCIDFGKLSFKAEFFYPVAVLVSMSFQVLLQN